MKVDIYRSQREDGKFHIHLDGSKCEHCCADPEEREVEMPEVVYKALQDRFATQGYVIAPRDLAVSEAVSDWWSVVSLLIPT